MRAADQIRSWTERAAVALEWMRAHAGLVMAAAMLLASALWLTGHDARLRREAELGQMRRETAAEVSALRTRAEGAMKELRANERTIRDLESRRTNLEREAAALRARLNFLREEERARVPAAATLGQTHESGRVAQRPDPAWRASDPPESGAVAAREVGSEISDLRIEGDAAGPAPSRASAEGKTKFEISDLRFESGASEAARTIRGAERPESGREELLSAEGASEMTEAALDSCREQSAVQDALTANCEERSELNRQALEAAKRSALELGEALRAKDAIAARFEAQHRAELKAARGSVWNRFTRAVQYVGVGVVIGMAVAR